MNTGLYTSGIKLQKFKFDDELNRQLVDFDIKCMNGVVKAHKIILSSRCSYFRTLMDSRPDIKTVTFGDVSCEMMTKAMEVVYGTDVHIPELHVDEFMRICHILRLDHWIKFEGVRLDRPSDMSASDSAPDMASPTEDDLSRHSGEGESSH